ncbi:MFS transporter [Sinorhizobium sp. RAC02]|uniref:MFS transporter n=1 Tax=Sinorhizobium sp. RAC02 TaxID=1842534 RepID=UPI0025703FDA|nr:MFS transporter [Sinorhizobium sp. RAC02]
MPLSAIPSIVWTLTGCIGLIGSNSLALGPIAPAMADALGTSVQTVMIASAAFGLGTAGGALALGQLIDRIGPQRMLAITMLLMVFGFAGAGAAVGPEMLIAAQFGLGIAAGVALPAIYTLAAVSGPPGHESRTLGIVLTGWTLSMVGGVPLSALIADTLGWRAFYFILAGAALLTAGALARRTDTKGAAGGLQTPLSALKVQGVLPLLAICACFMASFYGVYAYLGDHLHVDLGMPVSANGLATILYGIGFSAAVLLDRFIDAHIARPLLLSILMILVTAIFLLMFALSGSFVGLLVLMAVWGLANHLGLNVLIMRLTSLDPQQRGAIMGLNSAVTYLALFAGTISLGEVYASQGFRSVVLCAVGLMLAGVAISLIAARRGAAVKRDAERRQPASSQSL